MNQVTASSGDISRHVLEQQMQRVKRKMSVLSDLGANVRYQLHSMKENEPLQEAVRDLYERVCRTFCQTLESYRSLKQQLDPEPSFEML